MLAKECLRVFRFFVGHRGGNVRVILVRPKRSPRKRGRKMDVVVVASGSETRRLIVVLKYSR
jgi:hypothetical protein